MGVRLAVAGAWQISVLRPCPERSSNYTLSRSTAPGRGREVAVLVLFGRFVSVCLALALPFPYFSLFCLEGLRGSPTTSNCPSKSNRCLTVRPVLWMAINRPDQPGAKTVSMKVSVAKPSLEADFNNTEGSLYSTLDMQDYKQNNDKNRRTDLSSHWAAVDEIQPQLDRCEAWRVRWVQVCAR